ncbi:lipocalin family protein [Tenacibaculum pacificus]|uniref:lipocalin family protein n=1 Tax=Tenacibaculum pacificus TaxID=3018314 RepID=UPI0022F406C2|nr:lipocalin family protein [Tenacibaculum pacificus]WBX72815.1 lipocalin family protein [Tenacibaculum pacificus]
MKKLFLLIITAILVISRESKSDELPNNPEEPENTKDLIIGTWKLIQKNGEKITDSCEKKDTYIFNEDTSYTFDDYNTIDGSCSKNESKSFKGIWLNNNNKTYNIRIHGYTGNGADYNITFTQSNQYLTFENNGLTYERQ